MSMNINLRKMYPDGGVAVQLKTSDGSSMYPAPSELILGKVGILEAQAETAEQLFLLKCQFNELRKELDELKGDKSNGYA